MKKSALIYESLVYFRKRTKKPKQEWIMIVEVELARPKKEWANSEWRWAIN